MAEKLLDMNADLKEIFRAAYLYRQKYQHPTREREFWMAAAKEMSSTVEQLGDHPFARMLFLCCYQDIERELLEHEPPEQQKICGRVL